MDASEKHQLPDVLRDCFAMVMAMGSQDIQAMNDAMQRAWRRQPGFAAVALATVGATRIKHLQLALERKGSEAPFLLVDVRSQLFSYRPEALRDEALNLVDCAHREGPLFDDAARVVEAWGVRTLGTLGLIAVKLGHGIVEHDPDVQDHAHLVQLESLKAEQGYPHWQ